MSRLGAHNTLRGALDALCDPVVAASSERYLKARIRERTMLCHAVERLPEVRRQRYLRGEV